MSELYMMVTITNRQLTRKFVECYKEKGAQVGSVTVGMGTAANEILDYFGLDGMEKSVLFHLVTDAAWRQIKAALRKKMQIDLPGMGIAFIIPVSSVGGKKALNYLTCGQEFVKGEESTLKETKNELLVVPIMDIRNWSWMQREKYMRQAAQSSMPRAPEQRMHSSFWA